MNHDELAKAAMGARAKAYAPYSGYAVGAAVESTSGAVFTGANIENAAYGSTMCAERVAVYQMLMAGEKRLRAIAVATEDGSPPCGACLQVLSEFAPDPAELQVLLVAINGLSEATTLAALLPKPFRLETS